MQRTGTKHEVNGVDANHRTILEQFAQNAQSDAVVGVVERRHDDAGVADVKVRIACRQAPDRQNKAAPAWAAARLQVLSRLRSRKSRIRFQFSASGR